MVKNDVITSALDSQEGDSVGETVCQGERDCGHRGALFPSDTNAGFFSGKGLILKCLEM